MIKKLVFTSLLVLGLSFQGLAQADELMDITRAAGYEVSEVNRPKSSIIIDANTGDILWQDNPDEVRDPASMSKLMTLYLTYEAIEQGKLSEDTVITATDADQAIAGIYAISNNKIVSGVDYTVSELITMTAVPSSNVTTVMLANAISDNDPDKFLDMMNAKSQELGMTNTKWFNASGAAAVSFEGYYLPTRYDNNAANETTARDMAILSANFVKKYPQFLDYTDDPVVTVKAGTPYEETFETYNYSVEGALYGVEGVDGLKTGSSPRGAFNYIATAKRGEQRLVEVIMGVGDWSDQNGEYYRHPFGNALLEKAYADYEYKKIFSKGDHEIDGKTYHLEKDFYATVKKGEEPKLQVKDGVLSVENGLESVSPNLTDTLKVEEASTNIIDSAAQLVTGKSTAETKVTDKLLNNKWLLAIIGGIFFILLAIVLEVIRRYKKSRMTK